MVIIVAPLLLALTDIKHSALIVKGAQTAYYSASFWEGEILPAGESHLDKSGSRRAASCGRRMEQGWGEQNKVGSGREEHSSDETGDWQIRSRKGEAAAAKS